MKVIAMWAHSRSASTAFLRMMIERGDVTVVHEPFLALAHEPTQDRPRTTVRNLLKVREVGLDPVRRRGRIPARPRASTRRTSAGRRRSGSA